MAVEKELFEAEEDRVREEEDVRDSRDDPEASALPLALAQEEAEELIIEDEEEENEEEEENDEEGVLEREKALLLVIKLDAEKVGLELEDDDGEMLLELEALTH